MNTVTIEDSSSAFGLLVQTADWLLLSTLVLLIAQVAVICLAGKSPGIRNAIWRMALTSLLLLPVLQWLLPEIQVRIPISFSSTLPVSDAVLGNYAGMAMAVVALLIAFGAMRNLLQLLMDLLAVSRATRHTTPCADAELAGLLDNLCQHNGITQPVSLYLADSVASPCTWGVFQHRVILPANALDWNHEVCHCVLGHELGHVARNDWFFFILGRVTASLYWFNPLVWTALAGLEAEAEKACDDIAIDDSGCRFMYADCLLSMAENMRPGAIYSKPAMLGNHSQLSKRIAHILHPHPDRHFIPRESFIPYLFATTLLTTGLASVQVLFQADQSGTSNTVQIEKLIPIHYVPAHSQEFNTLMASVGDH